MDTISKQLYSKINLIKKIIKRQMKLKTMPQYDLKPICN